MHGSCHLHLTFILPRATIPPTLHVLPSSIGERSRDIHELMNNGLEEWPGVR